MDLHGKAKVLFGLQFGQEMPGADKPVLEVVEAALGNSSYL